MALGLDDKSLAFGYALISDNAVYIIWLPLLLMSKNFAGWFQRFTRVPEGHVEAVHEAAGKLSLENGRPAMVHYLYLAFIGFGVTALAAWLARYLPEIPSGPEAQAFITTSTWNILLVTFFGVLLSFTRAGRIPGSHPLSMALVYLFVARMGATADLSRLEDLVHADGFQGHGPVDGRIESLVNHAHGALAQRSQDLISAEMIQGGHGHRTGLQALPGR